MVPESVLRHRDRERARYWNNHDEMRRKRRMAYHRKKAERGGAEASPNAGHWPPPNYADSIAALDLLVKEAHDLRVAEASTEAASPGPNSPG